MSKARELSVVPQQSIGFKNRIINGAMNIVQRGGYAASLTAGTTQYGGPDRWFAALGSGTTAISFQQASSDGLAGFPNCLLLQRSTGQTNTSQLYVGQQIESNNLQDLQGQTISISFLARCGADYSATSKALAVYTVFGTGTNQASWGGLAGSWTGWTIQVPTTATLTTSWQKFTAIATVPSNANEMQLTFGFTPTGTAGTADWFEITGVQIEKGSNATSFDYRPYGTELNLCLRYTWKYTPGALYPWIGAPTQNTTTYAPIYFPVPMRAAPTITDSSPSRVTGGPTGNQIAVYNAGYAAGGTPSYGNITPNQFNFCIVANGAAAGVSVTVDTGGGYYFLASAEL